MLELDWPLTSVTSDVVAYGSEGVRVGEVIKSRTLGEISVVRIFDVASPSGGVVIEVRISG